MCICVLESQFIAHDVKPEFVNFFVYAECRMVKVDIYFRSVFVLFVSMDVMFTSVRTVVFICQGSNHLFIRCIGKLGLCVCASSGATCDTMKIAGCLLGSDPQLFGS